MPFLEMSQAEQISPKDLGMEVMSQAEQISPKDLGILDMVLNFGYQAASIQSSV